MIRLFGHRWAVRWGQPDEAKEVKVFSNCPEAELFVNGISAGRRRRNSADFPAAGLRWSVRLREGANTLRVLGWRDGIEVADEIRCDYQSTPWGPPARLVLSEADRRGDVVTLEARALDAAGVACLDAALIVRFGVTGDARLFDNLGTATGSRLVQLANGRARISLSLAGALAVASVSSEKIATQVIVIKKYA
jgi:beta-galactosidase